MADKQITLYAEDQHKEWSPIQVDEEEFEIIKLMVAESGALEDSCKRNGIVQELRAQGYGSLYAFRLCYLACQELRKEY